jgi:PAT family beta-lactamase induction signal transducer AmpG
MNWFLSENRVLRFSSFAVYYIAQGLPIGLLSIALPAWLSEQGLSATDIAFYVAISGLPWAFKLVAGPIMDRFSFLPMGRRRPWIVGSQIGLLIAMVVLSLVPDPVNQIVLLTWAAFAVNCFAAVQDVAVDGMAIDVLPNDDRGRANSFMALGQVAGYAGSGALSALALVQFGLLGAGLFLTFGLFLIFIWGVVVRERKGERLFPWSEGEALSRSITLQADDWMSIARDLRLVFFLKASLIMIVVTGCWRIAAGFWLVGAPVIVTQDLGYESTVYSYWTSTFSMVAAVLGLLLGPLIDKTGAKRILFVALIGYGLTFFIAGNLLDLWKVPVFLLSIAAAEALLTQAIFISFIALHMSICWNKVSATQFAIYMAWANLGRSIGAKIYGEIAPNLEQGEALMIMGALGFVGAALVLLLRTRDHAAHLETLTNSRVAGTS